MHRALCFSFWACVRYPHWIMPMRLAISLVLMTTWVEWQNTSRPHCRSKPPHPWSLCNGPKFWDNVWLPTISFLCVGHLRSVSLNFLLSNGTGLPSYAMTPSIAKSEALEWISKSLSKSGNFNIGAFTKMPFKVSKASSHASSHS